METNDSFMYTSEIIRVVVVITVLIIIKRLGNHKKIMIII